MTNGTQMHRLHRVILDTWHLPRAQLSCVSGVDPPLAWSSGRTNTAKERKVAQPLSYGQAD